MNEGQTLTATQAVLTIIYRAAVCDECHCIVCYSSNATDDRLFVG